jgi:hypothetical protein
MLLTIRKEYYD